MSWQKSPTNLFRTWRAEASNPTQHPLLTHPQDTHTTLRFEATFPWGGVQPDISLLEIWDWDWWSSRPLAPCRTLYMVSLGHSEMPRHFYYCFCFLPVFFWDNSMIKEAHFKSRFCQKGKKKNPGSWLFLFWSSELRQKEEDNICGFNSCLYVVVSVYLDKYSLLWPLTLLHIGVLYAFRWSFLILFRSAILTRLMRLVRVHLIWHFCAPFGLSVAFLAFMFWRHRFCFWSVQNKE